MTDTPPEGYQEGFAEKPRAGLFDRLIKRAMPNGTVMRRYIAGSWILKIILGVVLIILIEQVNSNTAHVERATCTVVAYAEHQADTLETGDPNASPPRPPNANAAKNLRQLATNMRATGVHCPPRANKTPLQP